MPGSMARPRQGSLQSEASAKTHIASDVMSQPKRKSPPKRALQRVEEEAISTRRTRQATLHRQVRRPMQRPMRMRW
jgi:hypothetical protein